MAFLLLRMSTLNTNAVVIPNNAMSKKIVAHIMNEIEIFSVLNHVFIGKSLILS